MTDKKIKRPQLVFTLLVEVGRNPNDGLPKGATGGAIMCFASGVDEPEAVRETRSEHRTRCQPFVSAVQHELRYLLLLRIVEPRALRVLPLFLHSIEHRSQGH